MNQSEFQNNRDKLFQDGQSTSKHPSGGGLDELGLPNLKTQTLQQDATKTASELLDSVLADWCSTSVGRRQFLAMMPLLLSACASTPKTRYREGDNSNQATSLTPQDEARMTQEVLPQMRKDYPPLPDSSVQAYIADLGNKIVAANSLNGQPYQYNFTVVGVNSVNAFALPAGTVFVTAPLISMAESEAELAGVVGHEIGHIQARHTAERMEKAKREQGKSWMYAVGGGLAGGALGFGLSKLLCSAKDKECQRKALEYGAMAGVAGGMLVQKYGFMANSREDEMEADRIGFKTSLRAGYHKDHIGQFYSKLLQLENQHKGKADPLSRALSDALSTHPPSKERVAQMQELSAGSQNSASPLVSSIQFEKIQALCRKWIEAQPKKG